MNINDASKADVVFCGAGPVGLWTAVQLKLLNPSLNITVLDKYFDYQRIHNLFIHADSLRTPCQDPRLKKIVREFTERKTLSTAEIETKLSNLAKEVGIVIERGIEIKNPKEDFAKYSSAKVFVGADGAHSVTRKAIMKSRALEKEMDLQYIADFTFLHDEKAASMLKALKASVSTGHLVYEIHNKKTKQTTLRTIIPKEAFETMKSATRKNPKKLTDEDLHVAVKNTFLTFLQQKYGHEAAELAHVKEGIITTTTLGVYKSPAFVRQEKDRTYYLVGDAAFGVPFFRSLNNGLICGTELAVTIAEEFRPEEKKNFISKISDSFRKKHTPQTYNTFVDDLANRQIALAKMKAKVIHMGVASVEASHDLKSPINAMSLEKYATS